MKKVLLPQPIAKCGEDYLKEHGCEVIHGRGIDADTIAEDAKDCDAIIARIGDFSRKVIENGKNIKVIARHGAGYDNIDIEAAKEKGIWVTFDPVSNGNAVAEHCIALIMGCAKNISFMDSAVREGNFSIRNKLKTTEVSGKVLGIAGYGRIGKMVAQKAKLGLGMKILAYDVNIDKNNCDVDVAESFDELLEKSDFISVHMPLLESTRHLFNKEAFSKMKETAIFINCSRGPLVDENDLYEALKTGKISMAATDVFEEEPPKGDNPLLTLDNILISPHNAALTNEAMDKMALTAAKAVCDVLNGERPEFIIIEGK